MAKSRNRGGAKAHRKRVQKRNEKLGIQKKQIQKVFNQMYSSKMQELQESLEKLSGITSENNENEESNNSEKETQNTSSENTESNSN